MITRDDIKKAVKKLLPVVYTWLDPYEKIKESNSFNRTLNVTDEELEALKHPVQDLFKIQIKKKELRDCFDVEDLIDLIWGKVQQGVVQQQQQSNNALITLLFSMAAKIAKADGAVGQEEVSMMESLIADTFKMTPEDRSFAISCWNLAKTSPIPFEDYADDFYQSFASNTDLLSSVLSVLFQLAAADKKLHPEEERMLRYAVLRFGFTNQAFESLKASFFPNSDKYYQTLGCNKTDSNEMVRSAYRKLVADLHPDKFDSKGLPKEMMDFAKRRLQEINEAWDVIKKERGIN
jgi:DnaJ like chaperone protein